MEALDRLIMDRSFEDITVSALAREADVDRKTFYQHFGSMDGLLDAIAEDAVSGLLDEVELTMASGGGGDEAGALQAFFSALAEHMAKNTTLRQSYFEHMPSELLFERLARPLMRQVVERGLAAGTYSG